MEAANFLEKVAKKLTMAEKSIKYKTDLFYYSFALSSIFKLHHCGLKGRWHVWMVK